MRRHDPAGVPAHPFFLVTDEDVLTLRADHAAGLHRGLLFVLVLTIVAVLPALVWSGTSGRTWIEGNGLRVFTVPTARPQFTGGDASLGSGWDVTGGADRGAAPIR